MSRTGFLSLLLVICLGVLAQASNTTLIVSVHDKANCSGTVYQQRVDGSMACLINSDTYVQSGCVNNSPQVAICNDSTCASCVPIETKNGQCINPNDTFPNLNNTLTMSFTCVKSSAGRSSVSHMVLAAVAVVIMSLSL